MKELQEEQLTEITGGDISVSGPILNAVVNVINVIKEAGYSLGSGIRRISEDKLCPLE